MNARQVIEAEDPKSFLQSRQFYFVNAKCAKWNIDRNGNINWFAAEEPLSGYPMSHKDILDNKYYRKVKKFNMDGYRALHGKAPKEINISDIGYWLKNGTYVDAARKVSEAEDPKRFLKKLAPRTNTRVYSYMGEWDVGDTGQVISWKPYEGMENDDPVLARKFASAVKFDLEEYKQYWSDVGYDLKAIDICDVGFWMKDGSYEAAEDEWRQEARIAMQEAEDPKAFLRQQAPRNRCGICNAKTAWVVNISGVERPICQSCHMSGFTGPLLRRARPRRPRQEAEDPKSVFNKLNRPTEVKPEEHMSINERPWVEDQMYRWSAMWNTPFMIDNRERIRGCPAGTGTTAWGAIKDLLVRTNQESKTMFYVKIGGDPFPTFARGVIEAESPKHFLKSVAPTLKTYVVLMSGNQFYRDRDDDQPGSVWVDHLKQADVYDLKQFAFEDEFEWGFEENFLPDPRIEMIGILSPDRRKVIEWVEIDDGDRLRELMFPYMDEAESPKQAIKQFTVQHGMQFWTVDADGYIVDSRSVPGTGYDKLRMVAHFDVNDYIARNGHRPHGTIQLEQIAYWTKYSGQRVPAGMKINYPRRHRNP